jgi:hypothetical protein
MKREIAELWAKALRSGEFKQTTGQLEKNGKYCACGVLAAIALTEGICTYDVGGKFDGRWLSLSYNIMDWAGIAQYDEAFLELGSGYVPFELKGKLTSISNLNESGMSFDKIADIIDKHYKEF